MKLIKGVNDTIKTFQGKDVLTASEPGAMPEALTAKEALVNCCATITARELGSAKDLLLSHSIGQKIWSAKNELVLEEQEIELIKKIVEKNPQYNALVLGTLLKIIEDAEDFEVEPKEEKPVKAKPKEDKPVEAKPKE